MVDLGFIARVKNYALKNGLNPADYDERILARRERDALNMGKTRAEFMTEIFREVKKGIN